MRITTKMLDQAAMKTGIPLRGSSLLNQIQNGESNRNLLSGLQKNNMTNRSHAVDRTNYEKLEKAADNMDRAASALLDKEKDGLFSKAGESGDYSKVYDGIGSLVDSYNDTLKNLARIPGALHTFYRDSLTEAVTGSRELLEKVGVSMAKDGSLTVDRTRLEKADKEDVRKAFGTDSALSRQLQLVASHVAKGAQANLDSASMRYSPTGGTYTPASGRYDLRS